MKFARTLSFAGLAGSTVAALLLAQGCSSSSSTTEEVMDGGHSTGASSGKSSTTGGNKSSSNNSTTGASSSGGSTTSAAAGGGLPPAPMGKQTTSTAPHNFAIHHLYLGDGTVTPQGMTPSYTLNDTSWKAIGYNLDGLVSTSSSTDVCTPYTKGTTAQQIDGNNGIDNAFGGIIAQKLGSIANLSQTVSEKIIAGSFTIEIDTVGLDGTATQSATGLGGQLFAGSDYDGTTAPPLTGDYFSLKDNWPVNSALLTGTTVASGSKIKFPSAYVTNGTWVSGSPIDLTLSLSLLGQTLNITIHHALMSFDYTVGAGGQGLASNGTIAGALDTTEFLTAIYQVVGGIGTPPGSDCTLVSVVVPTIKGAQDLIIEPDGSVDNKAGTACNAISIGIAFDADEIAAPSVVAPKTDAGAAAPPCSAM